MKRLLIAILSCIAGGALASIVVLFDPASVPIANRVTQVIPSANELAYLDNTNALVNVTTLPPGQISDWKVENGQVVLLTQEDRTAIWLAQSNAAYASYQDYLVSLRDRLIAAIDAADDEQGRLIRALAEVTLEAHNGQATTMSNMMLAVAGATSLANLQSRFAAIPQPDQYTLSDLKTAITNKLADD